MQVILKKYDRYYEYQKFKIILTITLILILFKT